MHVGQGVTAKHQAQRGHQHQRMNTRVGLRLQVVAVHYQFALGGAGVAVFRTFLAVATQAIEVRLGTGQDQRGFTAR